jgi:hypothetical protein
MKRARCKKNDKKSPKSINDNYLERKESGKREGVKQDNVQSSIIDPNEEGYIDYELLRVENCGKKKMSVINKKGEMKIITINCEKPYCPRCGAKNGLLHKRRFGNVIARLGNLEGEFIRQFVFTLPRHLTPRFMSKVMLDKFVELVKRLIEREFGVLVKEKITKKGREKKYRLHKKVLNTLELFGGQGTFHPHVNVLIFEKDDKENARTIPAEQLTRIKTSYKYALEKLLYEKIETVDVHYSYHHQDEKIN